MAYFITMACYPSVMLDVSSAGNLPLPKTFWGPVMVFQVYNTLALMGNLAATVTSWPGPRYYWILVASLFSFIPFFIMCNYLPDKRHPLPVFFPNDYVYLLGAMIFSFATGYFMSLGIMFTPKYVLTISICIPSRKRDLACE